MRYVVHIIRTVILSGCLCSTICFYRGFSHCTYMTEKITVTYLESKLLWYIQMVKSWILKDYENITGDKTQKVYFVAWEALRLIMSENIVVIIPSPPLSAAAKPIRSAQHIFYQLDHNECGESIAFSFRKISHII